MNLKDLIKTSPNFIKVPITKVYDSIPPQWLLGNDFKITDNFLKKSQFWGRNNLKEYQLAQVLKILDFCAKNVPFYQKKWAEYGVDIKTIQDPEDIQKIPFTTKQDIINFKEEMVPAFFNRKSLVSTRSGGTTGSPANFYTTKASIDKELAFFVRYWKWLGYDYFLDDCAIIRGSYDIQDKVIKRRNRHVMSGYNFNKNKMIYYINYIYTNKIPFIQAYPSLAYELFRMAFDLKIDNKLSNVKAIFCASEKMYSFQREFIENNFNIPVYIHYGHQEQTSLFQQCKEHEYHVIMEYGYTEFLKNMEEDMLAEVVSTGFINYATPLIRYKTSDYVELQDDTPCSCGLPYPKIVRDVSGRSGDILITPKGNLIQPNHLEYAIRYISNFTDCLIIQDDYDHLTVLIVPTDNYTDSEGEKFIKSILWRLNDDMNIEIKLVDEIERPLNGKKRFTMNKYKNIWG